MHHADLLEIAPWLETQPFFLLGSASAAGDCDCSYRGRETAGPPEPLLKVVGPQQLVFPDYPGNNLLNTLGNLLERPEVSMLFVDFARQSTLQIQGGCCIEAPDASLRAIWPMAPRVLRVEVTAIEQASVAGLPHLVLA
ncbi:pyridoxamine 5'-phosphate oxidase family protein [Comamonas composti]|uniref:pyridoxamine 5'-phosphate oxidase family protein n=1 Tax=Comamonas composti TaxID=408558 RepID=UPI00047B72CC|nr:pyridoxamine 5'-phosphate oxidase family protein [Comamonas composti]